MIALLICYTYTLGQIIVFDLEKQHAQKTSNIHCCSLTFSYFFCNFFPLEHIDTVSNDTRKQLNQISTSLSTLSNMLVSLLHPWLFDRTVDQVCHDRLQLRQINRYLSYGILSKNEHLSIVLPTWQQYLHENIPESHLTNPTTLITFVGMEMNEADALKQYVFNSSFQRLLCISRKQERMESYIFHWRWKYSSILNTEHLLSLVTMVYILMNCDRWISNT